jgi:hypothetical protein
LKGKFHLMYSVVRVDWNGKRKHKTELDVEPAACAAVESY